MSNRIKRGATTEITISLPETLALEGVTKMVIAFKQSGRQVIMKETEDIALDTSERTMITTLSETETLAMKAGPAKYEVGLKYESGKAARSYIYPLSVEDTLLNREV